MGEVNETIDDGIAELLRRADGEAAVQPNRPSGVVAQAAMLRVGVRRVRRWVVSVAAVAGLAALAAIPQMTPRRQGATVAELRAEVDALRARADRLAAEVTVLRQQAKARPVDAAASLDGTPLLRAAVAGERDQAAYLLLRSADRCRDAGADATLVSTAYRRAAEAFPETASGAVARARVEGKP